MSCTVAAHGALDLAAMIRGGHGERHLPIIVRWRDYGQSGQLQLRPPMPMRTNSHGGIATPAS